MKLDLVAKTIAGLVFLSSSFAAQSASLEIQFTGLDLIYNGSTIYDAGSINGGTGDPADADALLTMDFLVDGSSVGSLTTNIFADVGIDSVTDISTAGETVTSGSGFFDLLTSSSNPGWGLELDFSSASIAYIVGGGIEIAIFGASVANTGNQDLPFGLVMGDTVTFTFSSTNFTTESDGSNLTGFTASATGNATGSLVPVPAAIWLFGSGLLGLVGMARRKKAA